MNRSKRRDAGTRVRGRVASAFVGALIVLASNADALASPEPIYHPPIPPLVVPLEPTASLTPPVVRPSPAHPLTGADGQPLTMLPGESRAAVAGRTPGSFAVTSAGAASYRIALSTPPGVGDVELGLALRYNSRAGNGVLGVGWTLDGLSAISRCNRTWAQDGAPAGVTNTEVDRFCLDGQQLKLTSAPGTYGKAGSTYATEIESFSLIVANGAIGAGPASFTVTTKNGLVYEYGSRFAHLCRG